MGGPGSGRAGVPGWRGKPREKITDMQRASSIPVTQMTSPLDSIEQGIREQHVLSRLGKDCFRCSCGKCYMDCRSERDATLRHAYHHDSCREEIERQASGESNLMEESEH